MNHSCKLICDVTIISADKVLLVKYKDENKYDHQSGWFLPDDLLKDFEHPEDAALRILEEQTGIKDLNPELAFIESFKGADQSWHLVFHYKAESAEEPVIIAQEEIKDAKWFGLKDLPDKKEVAHHGWALYTIAGINN